MDNLTHTLTGLMMARAGLGKSAEKGSALMIMLASNTPDIDVAWSGLPGGLRYLEYHRGIAHSLTMAPVMALIPLFLAHWIAKSNINWKSYAACIVGVLGHLAMDLTNVYGVRLLLPFSSRWLHLDITDIIDPWIIFGLIVAIAAPALVALVSSEIGRKKVAGPKASWAVAVLIAIFCYEGLREASHSRAMAQMGSHLYGSLTEPRIWAIPDRIDPLRWRGEVETEDFVLTANVLVTEDFNPIFGHVDYFTQDSSAIDLARTTEPFQVFEQFDQAPFWRVSSAGDKIRVELIDLRFGTPQRPGFMATAFIAPDQRVLDSHFSLGELR